MKKNIKKRNLTITLLVWSLLSICNVLYPTINISLQERRLLKTFPNLSLSTILSGNFMDSFENYATDQFIYRDTFRMIKANINFNILQVNDNNGYIYDQGYLHKMNYPTNNASIYYATNLFTTIYNSYLEDSDVQIYSSVIYDKGYYMSDDYLKMEYQQCSDQIKEWMSYSEYIEINTFLELSDYYYTDSHWKQENIVDLANYLLSSMDSLEYHHYNQTSLGEFNGVYYGQIGLQQGEDELIYLSNDILDECVVQNIESSSSTTIYDKEKLQGLDAYDFYLSGASPLIEIDNPNATSQKELVIFRDSFTSSLAPLLIQSYQKITLIDLRYMNSNTLDHYITFDNQDVLFIYSTLVLNDSATLK
ncbi:DHHW family protein [Tannockella kyphosi]|uniref:DHHW family protein n=1 Tax=Tannockella kyphosi TaxID=2899121 RepID=UPI002011CF96|nr:DHHW family protein [Tannockella kyphosi]